MEYNNTSFNETWDGYTVVNYLNSSQSSLFQLTENNTQFLGTEALTAYRNLSADSQLQFVSNNGIFQLTANNSLFQPVGNYLTTAALSNHTHSDLYQTIGNYLTTAALSNHTHSDLYQSTGNYLTTAALSNHTHSDLYINVSDSNNFQTAGNYLTTAALSNHTHSDLYQTLGNYLTTAAQSDHTHSDLYQITGNYLTTAAQSGHSHGDPVLALTNLTGTTASASSGFTISLSAAAPAAGATLSRLDPFNPGAERIVGQIGQNSIWIMPVDVVCALQLDRIHNPIMVSLATASTATVSITQQVGIYTLNNTSQLGLLSSFGNLLTINHSGTQNSAVNNGVRYWTNGVGSIMSLSQGNYWFAFRSSTTYSSQAGVTVSNFIASNINSIMSGYIGSANNASYQWFAGQGSYSVTSADLPANIGFSELRGSAAVNLRVPIWFMTNGTNA